MSPVNAPVTNLFAAKAATNVFIVGPHSVFQYGSLIMNDRSLLEGYWCDEFQGFEDPDLRLSADVRPNQDGEDPGPGLYGGRTLTISGWIRAGTYPRLLVLAKNLELAFQTMGIEQPLIIRPAAGSVYFTHPQMYIYCRKSDRVNISRQTVQKDMSGVYERKFQITLRASDPWFQSVSAYTQTIVPTVVSFLGRVYDRAYNLVYVTTMNSTGDPAAAANKAVVTNAGDYPASPVIRFNGYMRGVVFTNNTNGDRIQLTQDILDGDYVEVNVKEGTVLDRNGNNKADAFGTTSDWLKISGAGTNPGQVPGGANELALAVSAFGTHASVATTWQDTSITG